MVAEWWNGWDPAGGPFAAYNSDGSWTVTLDPAPEEGFEYLWIVDGVHEDVADNFANGECASDNLATGSDEAGNAYANRNWAVDSGNVTDAFGICDTSAPGDVSTPTLTATVTAPGATSVGIVGPWWNGWDPTAGPVATDNGDGTWTVVFDPAPDATMEYKWLIDGTQEDLITPAAAGQCTADIDAGTINTDYA